MFVNMHGDQWWREATCQRSGWEEPGPFRDAGTCRGKEDVCPQKLLKGLTGKSSLTVIKCFIGVCRAASDSGLGSAHKNTSHKSWRPTSQKLNAHKLTQSFTESVLWVWDGSWSESWKSNSRQDWTPERVMRGRAGSQSGSESGSGARGGR